MMGKYTSTYLPNHITPPPIFTNSYKIVGRVGAKYLNLCLGDLIREVYSKTDLTFEVDPARLTGEDPAKQAEANMVTLTEYCQKFVDRITSKAMMEEMPREIKSICYFLVYNGEQYKLDMDSLVLPLIAGFVLLRCKLFVVKRMIL